MNIDSILAIIGLVVGTGISVGSLIYAVKTNREKAKLETLVQTELAYIAGNIQVIRANPQWADRHFQAIRDKVLELEAGEQVQEIIKQAHDGARDVTAAERMLGNLLNEVLALQKGLFGTEEVHHPDYKTD
jgi:hypothetical protein